MAEIVNLRRARKAKARQVKDEQAAQNRAVFGRSKAETTLTNAQIALAERQLDAHKRDKP
jgi:hypothetical protein